MWRETTPWVTVDSPSPLLVPGSDVPESVRIEALERPADPLDPTSTGSVEPDTNAAAQTLYADPASAEPWADRAVMVGRLAASENEEFFNNGEGSPVTIQGSDGRVGQDHGQWWAAWTIPTTCEVCEQEAFVIGHDLTRDGVLAIAETVRQEPTPQANAATLPGGLQSLGSTPDSGGWIQQPSPQRLVVKAGSTERSLNIWSGDPRLYAHLAFWFRDDPSGPDHDLWPIDLGENVVTFTPVLSTSDPVPVEPSGTEAATLREAATALVPGDDAAVDAAVTLVVAGLEPIDTTQNLCDFGDGPWETFSGVVGDTRWGVTVMLTGSTAFMACHSDWPATSVPKGSVGSFGTTLPPIGAGGARVTSNGGTTRNGQTLQTVTGDVPATAVRVRVERGGLVNEVVPGSTGPAPGRRWFATAFLLDGLGTGSRNEITAFDASGAVVATGSQG